MRHLIAAIVVTTVLTGSKASATLWNYTYKGHLLPGTVVGDTTLSAPSVFTIHARFDDSSTNLADPVGLPGFVAYAPTRASLSVGGAHYDLQPWNGTSGIAVSIFDETTPFGNGHVASGIIQDVLADGAGIVGDWLKSTPEIFSGGKLEPFRTTYADFFGVGFGAGPCPSGCVAPIPALLNGAATSLTLPNDDVTYKGYQFVGPPFTPYRDFASLTLAPEPGGLALFGLAVTVIAGARRRR